MPVISSLSIPRALFAAVCCSVVKVEGGAGGSVVGKGMMSGNCQTFHYSRMREQGLTAKQRVREGYSPGEKGTTEVKGEYGRASSTVGGRKGMAVCQLPLVSSDMVKSR